MWIDPFKVGKTAGLQKITEFMNSTDGPGNEEYATSRHEKERLDANQVCVVGG